MTTFLRFFAVFMILTLVTTVMSDLFNAEFGDINYWQSRGVFFLFFVTFFPRLTLLFSSVVSGGIFWWLGFFFWPRLLVATLATAAYWNTNPMLVTASWFVAIFGEIMEKTRFGFKSPNKAFNFKVYRGSMPGTGPSRQSNQTQLDDENVFEAEFTKKD